MCHEAKPGWRLWLGLYARVWVNILFIALSPYRFVMTEDSSN